MTDTERLDWLQRRMTPADSYCEIYLAGLRNGHVDATAFQVELQNQSPHQAATLREAIDRAIQFESPPIEYCKCPYPPAADSVTPKNGTCAECGLLIEGYVTL